MIILVAVSLFIASLLFFLSVKATLWLLLPSALSQLCFKLGSILILSSFALLLAAGVVLIIKQILCNLYRYFSTGCRVKRKALFFINKQNHINSLFGFKYQKIIHTHELAKKKLIEADNKKQIYSLSKAIQKDLLSNTITIPPTSLKQLKKEHDYFLSLNNGEALSKLHQKITGLN